jgi:hypothetical protein
LAVENNGPDLAEGTKGPDFAVETQGPDLAVGETLGPTMLWEPRPRLGSGNLGIRIGC